MTASLQPGASASFASPHQEHESTSALVVALRGYLAARALQTPDVLAIDFAATELQRAVQSLGAAEGLPFSVLFAPSAALVAGRFLRAPRWVHEAADEVRIQLAQGGISELLVHGEPSQQDLDALVGACCSEAVEPERECGMLRWHAVSDLALVRGLDLEDLDPDQTFETTYAWAVTSLKRLTQDLAKQSVGTELRARQIARALISLPETDLAALVHSDRVRARLSDPAERAIGRTILAIAMLRRLTSEPWELLEVAIASMLLDVMADAASLAAAPAPLHPSMAARALQAISRTDEGSVLRTVVAYEALWLEHQTTLGPLYGGNRLPSPHASIVYAAHRCFARPEGSILEAIERLEQRATTERDRAVVRLVSSTTGQRLAKSEPAHAAADQPNGLPPDPAEDLTGERAGGARDDVFSDEDMADILADLEGDESLAPMRVSLSGAMRRRLTRSSSPGPAPNSGLSHTSIARSTQALCKPSVPPVVVQGSSVQEVERQARADAAFDLAEAAYAAGDLDEALSHADTAVMFMPQKPAYIALQAYLESVQGDADGSVYDALIDRMDRAFAGALLDARAYYYRGMLLRCAGKPFASKQAFRKGLELNPDDPDLLAAMADR